MRGKGGLQEFTDEAVADPALQRVRGVTTAVGDPAITEDQVHIEVMLTQRQTSSTKFVEQSLGNVHRPLSNEQLTEKFVDQAVLALPRQQVDAVVEQMLARRRARRRRRSRARDDPARRRRARALRARTTH